MRRLLLPILALLGGSASAQTAVAPVKVHALFVGINNYKYSSANVAGAGFENLKGAVGDVGRFKAALVKAYGWNLDRGPETTDCRSENEVSITLTDACATREAILRSFAAQINAARPGETVLLYFAGHGTIESDGSDQSQAVGPGTLVPHDARDPANTVREIYDAEIHVFVDAANRRGVNVIGVFDSCHSGTMMRDPRGTGARLGRARTIRSMDPEALKLLPPLDLTSLARKYELSPPIDGVRRGFWASLGASEDNEKATETDSPTDPAGLFTSALVSALAVKPQATFGDLIAEARLKIAAQGILTQHPKVESAVTQSFAGGTGRIATFEAHNGPNGILLDSGGLSGVTQGSQFALFGSEADAIAEGARPLVMATAVQVGSYAALLAVPSGTPALPERLVAIEKVHNWGAQRLVVSFREKLANGPANQFVRQILAKLDFVSDRGNAEVYLTSGDGIQASLYGADGTPIARFTDMRDPAFEASLGEALRNKLRAKILIGLASGQKDPKPLACVRSEPFDANECQPDPARAGKAYIVPIGNGATYKVSVRNTADEPRIIYVFSVSPDGQYIDLVLPEPGAANLPTRRLGVIKGSARFQFPTPGIWRFVAISSLGPINTAAIEQRGIAARDPAKCVSALDAALCAAGKGQSDTLARGGLAWSASVSEVKVQP